MQSLKMLTVYNNMVDTNGKVLKARYGAVKVSMTSQS